MPSEATLISNATTIRNETAEAANTATRVGDMFLSLVDALTSFTTTNDISWQANALELAVDTSMLITAEDIVLYDTGADTELSMIAGEMRFGASVGIQTMTLTAFGTELEGTIVHGTNQYGNVIFNVENLFEVYGDGTTQASFYDLDVFFAEAETFIYQNPGTQVFQVDANGMEIWDLPFDSSPNFFLSYNPTTGVVSYADVP